ncbi:MAG: ribosome maturation factor RimM [Bryobacteraceae bacterium]
MSEQWVSIGRLFRVRGNRGELLGELDSQKRDREKSLTEVALEAKGRRAIFQVEEIWRHDGRPVFKFEGIDSISDAEAWEHAEILVRGEDVAPPEEGEYSFADLIGSQVVRLSGEPLGVVKSIEEYGGPLLLNVEAKDGRQILVPFARSICKEIDAAARIIRVELPEGLTEL